MKWKRTDAETKAKICEMHTIWIQWSEIARELEMSERTVQHIIDTEFADICGKSQAVANLIDRNNNLQSAGDALIAEMILDKADWITIAQLTTLRQSTFTQNQILTWKPTDIFKHEWLSSEQAEKIAKLYNIDR